MDMGLKGTGMKSMRMKGIVFTTDMIIGLSLAIVLLLLIPLNIETSHTETSFQELLYQSNDLVNLLSTIKASSFSNTPTISSLLSDNVITAEDLSQTILDLIGGFWYSGNETIASNITKDVLENLTTKCFSLKTQNQIIYSSPSPTCSYSSDSLGVSQRISSGYELGKPVSGYAAGAFITSILSKKTSSYAYFGGYVGQGNITTNITLSPFDAILGAYMELDAGNNFSLYINGNYAGFYPNGTSGGGYMRADKWDLTSGNFSFFHAGENRLQINFIGTNNSYIGGGYFKVTYNTTELAFNENPDYKRSYLPGIDGIINLYDSFYIPGSLSTMNVFLHYKSDVSIYMEVGNRSFYINTTLNPNNKLLDNSTLAAILDYMGLSQRTVPIRIGHYAMNATGQMGYVSDVVLTTSLASQMSTCDVNSSLYADCNTGAAGSQNTRIDIAKVVDTVFVNTVLNGTGNRVGLLGYWTPGHSSLKEAFPTTPPYLSSDNNSLISQINTYTPQNGDRCCCCAIHTAATNILTDQSRKRYVVLMSDGVTDNAPSSFCPSTTQCWTSGLITQAQYNSLTTGGKATVDEAYNAYLNNIIVDTVGFGSGVTSSDLNLLNLTAICGGGHFNNSANYTELLGIYKTFGAEIANQSSIFSYQTIVSSNFNSTLYPDSYIELNYTPAIIPYEYGEISLTRETERFKNFTGDTIDIPYKEGWFNVSEKVKVTDARVTSYSSQFWTDRMYAKNASSGWNTAYWLGDYGNYTALGDPFIVEIPVKYLGVDNNSVRIGTGFAPDNATGGSPDDRIIYSIRLKGSVGYGDTFSTSELASADAKQRLIEKISDYVDISVDDIQIETHSVSGVKWLWGPSMFKVLMWERG